MSIQEQIFMLIGGLGLFLFGIKLMGNSLKALAGDRIRDLINRFTSNKFSAVLIGILATVAIQSSSGTTALTISLVRSGLMNLSQSIGVIMGANIGTTVTAFLLGLNVKDFALPIIFIGSAIFMFSQKKKTSLYGQIIFGFGLLFYGMVVMETPLSILSDTPQFESLMVQASSNPMLGILIGMVLTMIVQSSSATIGILQGLFYTGAVSFPIAFAILLGDNIGTTITSILASLGGSKDSKRAAMSHLVFNIFGTLLFFVIMFIFNGIDVFENIIFRITDNAFLQIAFSHFFFNVTVTMILIWFIPQIEKLVRFIIPSSSEEIKNKQYNEGFLEETLIHEAPVMAFTQAKNAVNEMSNIIVNQMDYTLTYFETNDKKSFEEIEHLQIVVNILDKKLKVFLRDLAASDINENDGLLISAYMYSVNDLKRISDRIVTFSGKYKAIDPSGKKLSEESKNELTQMLQVGKSVIKNTTELLLTDNHVIAGKIYEKEKYLDNMERKYYKRHLLRVKNNECVGELTVIYPDLLSDLERIGDHGKNIAKYMTNENEVLTEEEKEIDLMAILSEV